MGGIVAMTTALEHPSRVAGLVLIGTASQCSAKAAAWYERIARAGENDGLEGLASAIYGADSGRALSGNPVAIAAVTRALASLHTDPLTPRLAEIDCPALLLVGEKDPMGATASEIISGALHGSHLELFPGNGHWLHQECPDLLLQTLRPWAEKNRDHFTQETR